MSATMKAAVYLGQGYQDNHRTTMNTDFEQIKTLFDISQSLILTKVRYSRYLRLNGMVPQGWERLCCMTERSCCRMQRYTSLLILCFVWERFDTANCSLRFKERWQKRESNLRNSKIGSSSCRSTMTSTGRKQETSKSVLRILWMLRLTHTDSRRDIGHSSDQERKKSGMECTPTSPEVCGTSRQKWGHPVFRTTSTLDRGFLKQSKKGGRLSVRYTGDLSKAELFFFFGTIISVNQLSVYGAISDWCEELAQQISGHSFSSTRKPVAKLNEQLDCRLSPEVVSITTNPLAINVPAQGNLLRSQSERFETLPEDVRVIQSCETGFMRFLLDVSWQWLGWISWRRWSIPRIHFTATPAIAERSQGSLTFFFFFFVFFFIFSCCSFFVKNCFRLFFVFFFRFFFHPPPLTRAPP